MVDAQLSIDDSYLVLKERIADLEEYCRVCERALEDLDMFVTYLVACCGNRSIFPPDVIQGLMDKRNQYHLRVDAVETRVWRHSSFGGLHG